MSGQPKAPFWLAVWAVILGLVGLAAWRGGMLEQFGLGRPGMGPRPMAGGPGGAGGPAGAGGISYSMSKRGVIRQAERKAAAWGKRGARIVSVSPGLILTSMGRKELAETHGAAQMNDAAPAGRSGTAMEIALAVQFLASDNAAFITGCDLRVDGGSVGAMRSAQA